VGQLAPHWPAERAQAVVREWRYYGFSPGEALRFIPDGYSSPAAAMDAGIVARLALRLRADNAAVAAAARPAGPAASPVAR